MQTHSDPAKRNTNQSVSESLSQKGGGTNFQFVNNRQEAITQKKNQEMADASPRSKQLRELQKMADSRPQIVQRTVIQSASFVASQKGKWYSDKDSSAKRQFFDTKEEAEAYEAKLNDAKKKNDEEKLNRKAEELRWNIIDTARRHYKDGWGASYGITDDEKLKRCIDANSTSAKKQNDNFEISLGKKANEMGHQMETCNILYEEKMITVEVEGVDFSMQNVPQRVVFHCGPSTRASESASGTKNQPSAISGHAESKPESESQVDRFPDLGTMKK